MIDTLCTECDSTAYCGTHCLCDAANCVDCDNGWSD